MMLATLLDRTPGIRSTRSSTRAANRAAPVPGVPIGLQVESGNEPVIEVEAGIQRRDAHQAAHKQRRDDKKHDGRCNLADDKRMPQPETTSDTAAAGTLHLADDAGVARAQGGNDAAQKSADQGEAEPVQI